MIFLEIGGNYVYYADMKAFGKRLAELRREKRVTQKKLGEILCVSGNTVHAWEADKQEPSLGVLVQIADYFEVSLDYLLGRSDY